MLNAALTSGVFFFPNIFERFSSKNFLPLCDDERLVVDWPNDIRFGFIGERASIAATC